MNKQVKLYCVKLNLVRTAEEKELGDKRYKLKCREYRFKRLLAFIIKKRLGDKKWTEDCSTAFKELIEKSTYYTTIEQQLKQIKKDIHTLYVANKDIDRHVDVNNIRTKDIIAIGSNNLTRTMGLDLGTFTDRIITVKVGKMDNIITDRIIKKGLDLVNADGIKQHYKFFTSGAGQTRTKKFMMIKDDDKLKDTMLCLMNGLTIEEINAKGGMNISKFLAYLSLNNSGSTVWEGFKINRCIVVEDFETNVFAKVDYISRKDNIEQYKDKLGRNRTRDIIKWEVNKNTEMDIPVPHFDGLGIMLPSLYKKNIQVRLPWIKGLLTPFDYIAYCKKNGYSTKVIDIYNKEWDVATDNIQVIFTKSQFKLYKFYSNWEDYKTKFDLYKCTANICMEDNDKDKYKDMHINYQMLQQLINMTDDQVKLLCTDFKELITKVHTDRNSQLDFLGATLENEHRNYFQEALRLYPEMCNSAFVNKQISEIITARKKEACSGQITIKDSKRMFILSDPIAFCDWLFGHKEVKEQGFLQDGEVYCNLYPKSNKLDCLRSPSLSFEHAIRTNVRATKGNNEWLITNGLYTSTKDIISKVLMFDVDGDESLVLSTEWVIDLAEDMIKTYKINPIYFEMGKAGEKEINMDNISQSLLYVYEKSNIGKVSNCLTKLWNSKNPMKHYKQMQELMLYNNFVIDSAKTLSIPKVPIDIKELMSRSKYPYFFQYAKKKKELECLEKSNSVMDRICTEIESIGNVDFSYKKGFGTFRTKTLMNNDKIEIDNKVIEYYLTLEKDTTDKINDYNSEKDEDKNKSGYKQSFYAEAKTEFYDYSKKIGIKYNDCIDMIIKYTYAKNDLKMKFLWNVFGKVIINNLNKNIKKPLEDGYIMCEDCGKRIMKKSNSQIRCKKCAEKEDQNHHKK